MIEENPENDKRFPCQGKRLREFLQRSGMCEVNIGSILHVGFSDFRDFILGFIDLLAKIQGIDEHFPTSRERLYVF